MIIKWLGQASFKIKVSNYVIYIDPVIGNYDTEEKANLILITHEHHDHFSKEIVDKLTCDDTKIVGNKNVISQIDGTILNNNESVNIDDIKIEAVPSYNVNKEFHPKGEGNGYIIELEGKRLYHCGDTDLIPEMNLIEADIMLVPVGGVYTMNYEDAAASVMLIEPDLVIPIHWGNIVGHKEDAENLKSDIMSETDEIRVKILDEGEEFEYR
ncbi:MBL fold metallo-hydrolase [Candidatus Woesearchaeota archaeon]|nr:MBL fold metallo-hydrolase [Candidatus Woesearchaeota archaeon]